MRDTKRIAFALGGLAGNNAHGAGFLEAALTKSIQPAMISCTSGQIYWVYQYLRCRKAGKPGLKAILQEDIRKVETFHNPDLDTAALAFWGKKGVFRTAYAEYAADAVQNAWRACLQTFTRTGRRFMIRRFLELLPCRILVPDFSEQFLKAITDELNASDIGIVFNSYNPAEGREYLHLNDAARKLLASKSNDPKRFDPNRPSSYRDRTIYKPITPTHILDALWLYQYGFTKERRCVDGAYFRDVILSELAYAEQIYVVRPLHFHWSGNLPRNYPEMEDLKTKLGFNGAYTGERYQILLMNKLIASGTLQATVNGQPKYHPIELKEIEMDRARGFFDYLFEDTSVFDAAFAKSLAAFTQDGGEKVEQPPKLAERLRDVVQPKPAAAAPPPAPAAPKPAPISSPFGSQINGGKSKGSKKNRKSIVR